LITAPKHLARQPLGPSIRIVRRAVSPLEKDAIGRNILIQAPLKLMGLREQMEHPTRTETQLGQVRRRDTPAPTPSSEVRSVEDGSLASVRSNQGNIFGSSRIGIFQRPTRRTSVTSVLLLLIVRPAPRQKISRTLFLGNGDEPNFK
jgi:hypothetical protein